MKKNLSRTLLILLLPFFSINVAYASSDTIDYTLPYPGILPDSPVYIVKTIRDKLATFLISHPVKKAEFSRNLSDKQIASALTLAEQKKDITLIETSLREAENYLRIALSKTREAKIQGIESADSLKKLMNANRKHLEVISDIEKKVKKEDKEIIGEIKKNLEQLGGEIEKMSLVSQ
jgi:hypothetical protein